MLLTIRLTASDRPSSCHIEVVDVGPAAAGISDGLRRYEARVITSDTGERHASSALHHRVDDSLWLLAQRGLLALVTDRVLPA